MRRRRPVPQWSAGKQDRRPQPRQHEQRVSEPLPNKQKHRKEPGRPLPPLPSSPCAGLVGGPTCGNFLTASAGRCRRWPFHLAGLISLVSGVHLVRVWVHQVALLSVGTPLRPHFWRGWVGTSLNSEKASPPALAGGAHLANATCISFGRGARFARLGPGVPPTTLVCLLP